VEVILCNNNATSLRDVAFIKYVPLISLRRSAYFLPAQFDELCKSIKTQTSIEPMLQEYAKT
jgi:hypothetical protein